MIDGHFNSREGNRCMFITCPRCSCGRRMLETNLFIHFEQSVNIWRMTWMKLAWEEKLSRCTILWSTSERKNIWEWNRIRYTFNSIQTLSIPARTLPRIWKPKFTQNIRHWTRRLYPSESSVLRFPWLPAETSCGSCFVSASNHQISQQTLLCKQKEVHTRNRTSDQRFLVLFVSPAESSQMIFHSPRDSTLSCFSVSASHNFSFGFFFSSILALEPSSSTINRL